MVTHREQVLQKLGLPKDTSLSLEELAYLTDLPIDALLEVYQRGYAAATTNRRSVRLKEDYSKNPDLRKFPKTKRLSNEQWAYARVYSFINKGPTFHTADADIVREYRLG